MHLGLFLLLEERFCGSTLGKEGRIRVIEGRGIYLRGIRSIDRIIVSSIIIHFIISNSQCFYSMLNYKTIILHNYFISLGTSKFV